MQEQRALLLDVRREHLDISVETIISTLVLDGRLQKGDVAASTLRRFYAEHGLDRMTFRTTSGDGRQRLR